jgi:S-formylglutathione hydrolase FrmB
MSSGARPVLAAMLLVLGIALAPPARAAGRVDCLSMSSRILGGAVRYCVLLPPSYDAQPTRRFPVLYFLHGLGDSEQTFVRSGGWQLIEDLWEQRQLGEFLIVTPDGDRSFYINSRDGRQRYEDFFIREFLPGIERRFRTQAGRSRGIAGVSMGGYGALRFALRYPQLFGAVSVHSAALLEKLPDVKFANPRQSALLGILGEAFGTPPDRAFWERNTPFALARSGHPAVLKIYFDCGSEDGYGFNVGAQQFHEMLASRGIAHEFHIYPGGHDWRYVAEHLSASLQFQSRAFGLKPSSK